MRKAIEKSMHKTMQELEAMATELKGIALWGCQPGTPPARAGLTYGDILISINGQRVHNLTEYMEASRETPRFTEVQFIRDGVVRSVKLDMDPVADDGAFTETVLETCRLRALAPVMPRGIMPEA